MKFQAEYTDKFEKLYNKLNTEKQIVIRARISRVVEDGYFGDYKTIEKDLFELRIFKCGGIRVYFTIKNNVIILLLSIGAKESKEQQQKDIAIARSELKKYKENI
jgi:putative addiction module killer protein